MSQLIRIAIACRSEEKIAQLQESLVKISTYTLSFIVTTGKDLIEKLKLELPDILLLDFQLPVEVDSGGSKSFLQLRSYFPKLKIIFLDVFNNLSFLKNHIRLGVNGLLLHSFTPTELYTCIDGVAKNGIYYENHLVLEAFMDKNNAPETESTATLNERERKIVALICDELTSQEIADRLFLSKKSIDYIRNEILRKINARNVAGIVKYAFLNGIVRTV